MHWEERNGDNGSGRKAGNSPARRLRRTAVLLLAGLLLGAAGVWPGSSAGGGIGTARAEVVSVPHVEAIRVALFIESGKYSAVTQAATLSSESGMTLRLRSAAGGPPVYQAAPKEPVRIYDANGYSALLLETGDAAQARSLAQKLAAGGNAAQLIEREKSRQTAWQVFVGPYPTKEAAAAAAQKAAAMAGGQPPVIAGPLRLAAGTFAAAADAAKQAAAIAQAGFDADVAVVAGPAAQPAYAVLVGGEADESALQALRSRLAAAVPGLALTAHDPSEAYVLKRTEHAVTADGTTAGAGLAIGGTEPKLWAEPNGKDGAIQVKERFGRSYRGGIELTKLNGKLAVVNELPLEQYVASVVGSELMTGWPEEALKAQAVAARTFALRQGTKYQIAHVSDTTMDQVYKGVEAEAPDIVTAVQETAGEVLVHGGGLIEPLFSSSAGGRTAESTEVWGNPVSYFKSIESPDEVAAASKKPWYRIVLPNGKSGYVHSDYARDTGATNPAGLPYYESTEPALNVRPAPYVDNQGNASVFQLGLTDRFVVIDKVTESNPYEWIRGPFTAAQLKETINAGSEVKVNGPLERLEVTKRGPSGRAIEVSANGQALKPKYPDAYRSLLNGLPSTLFEIEETGRYTILGANDSVRNQSPSMSSPYVLSANADRPSAQSGTSYVLSGDGKVRAVTAEPQYVFRGTGFGHGLGMSQWGARGLAEQGYDYKKILQTYYTGVSILKG